MADQRSGIYKADLAQRKATLRQETKAKRSDLNATVEANTLYYLSMDFSPEQIVGRAKIEGKRGMITGRVDIDQRPKIVEAKDRIGDLEIDLIIGKGHQQALLTINYRASDILLWIKSKAKKPQLSRLQPSSY